MKDEAITAARLLRAPSSFAFIPHLVHDQLALQHYLAVGAIMFVIGLIGFMTRRNLIVMFLCTELMFQGVAINLIAFGALLTATWAGRRS